MFLPHVDVLRDGFTVDVCTSHGVHRWRSAMFFRFSALRSLLCPQWGTADVNAAENVDIPLIPNYIDFTVIAVS